MTKNKDEISNKFSIILLKIKFNSAFFRFLFCVGENDSENAMILCDKINIYEIDLPLHLCLFLGHVLTRHVLVCHQQNKLTGKYN